MDVFDKIISGEIPSCKVHEDDVCVVILDINPIRKGHCLVISRKSVPVIGGLDAEEYAHMAEIARKVGDKLRSALGATAVNVFLNDGKDAGQEVPHVHIHVVPRKAGDGELIISRKEKYADGEAEDFCGKLRF